MINHVPTTNKVKSHLIDLSKKELNTLYDACVVLRGLYNCAETNDNIMKFKSMLDELDGLTTFIDNNNNTFIEILTED